MRVSLLVAAGAFTAATVAAVKVDACELRVASNGAAAGWDAALTEARQTLSSRAGDCDVVDVQIDAEAGVLTFTTVDGRRAKRTLAGPGELRPTLEALLVPLPPLAPLSASAPPPAPANDAGTKHAVSPPEAANVILSALIGGRVLAPDGFFSPSLILATSLSVTKWEVGIVAQWNPRYPHLDDDDRPNAQLDSISAGVAVGRRIPAGAVGFIAGATLSASILHEEWRATTGSPSWQEKERGQALAGLYASMIYPRKARTRFRGTLSGDVDATHLGGTVTVPGEPYLPWWGMTLGMGVECEVF